MPLRRLTLRDLIIDDEPAFSGVALYARLKRSLLDDGYPFLAADADPRHASWDRVLFLNLTFWDPEAPADVLPEGRLSADVVTHVAWHQRVRAALDAPEGPEGTAPSRGVEGFFLAEAVASAFDLYLVGRLLERGGESEFLETQVPAMTEASRAAGVADEDFAALLEAVAAQPEQAFEDLRALLFDVTRELFACRSPVEACAVLERHDGHRFGGLLHHYELSTWLLHARQHRGDSSAGPDQRALAIDRALRAAPVSLDLLEQLCFPST